jgi:cellulose synthase/poly-beta-1,6-N-acetylglucosamine synthase-like glycosyltransferase
LLIISGAFGMFDRQTALAAGGYDTSTVGEDLELVVRMRRYMHEVEKKKYKIAFIPDPLCWTEVPESLKMLSRQRNRWTRGAIETIRKHMKMAFNPKYGRIGMISFPYWIFFEWLAPIIQFLGIGYVILLTIFGLLDVKVFLIMTLFVLSFAVMYSFFSVLLEAIYYNKYKNVTYLGNILLLSVMEMFVYQPINMLFSLSGNIDYFFKKKSRHIWGNMTRKGFSGNTDQNSKQN